jgi:hypothetical protein
MNQDDVFGIIYNNLLEDGVGDKKFAIIWGRTFKNNGVYSIKLKDIHCIHIQDLREHDQFLYWTESFSAKESIIEKCNPEEMTRLGYGGFPVLLSKPALLPQDIYISFITCLRMCEFQSNRFVSVVSDGGE